MWGLRRALYWQIMHALKVIVGFNIHYVKVGSGMRNVYEDVVPVFPEGYEVRMVGLEDLLPYSETEPDLSPEFLKQVFRRGDVCVASFYDTDLVGFSFQSGSRAPVTGQLDILVPERFLYIYKTWVRSDHRRKNLSQVQGYVRRQSRLEEDSTWGIWYVETHNYPSLLHSYLHPRERRLSAGFIGWITVFGREIPFRSPRAKWLGVELVKILEGD